MRLTLEHIEESGGRTLRLASDVQDRGSREQPCAESGSANFVTGDVLPVDGGFLAKGI